MSRLLDLYCKAGGAAMGYHRAGFDEIVGVDIEYQPRYPFDFVQGDAIEYVTLHGGEFDAIHASPPCQFASVLTPDKYKPNHPNLIPDTRDALLKAGLPYVIENVSGARSHLIAPVMLCGSMFGIPIWRHRFFELFPRELLLTPTCHHDYVAVVVSGHTNRRVNGKRYSGDTVSVKRLAMSIDWMTEAEITEAIPPAYTEFLGRWLLAHVRHG